jgi:hypothetical protein
MSKLSMGEDLAERLDDLICAWDNVVGTEMDTVLMLLLGEEKKPPFKQNSHLLNLNFFISGWLGFGGLIFAVSHLVYTSIGPVDNVSLSSPAAIPP